MESIERVRKCIEESGMEVLDSGEIDGADSISFISAVLSIEEEFEMEFPDEYLLIETMSNIDNLHYVIQQIIENIKV